MSGTSVDAIDAALCEFDPDPERPTSGLTLRLLGWCERPFPAHVRDRVLQVVREHACPLDDLTELGFLLGDTLASAVLDALGSFGVSPADVDVIASHGQTIHHLVEPGRRRSTLQLGESAVIARAAGLTVVSNFRTADVAAGGQGAPLAPFLDALYYTHPERTRALQNIGGIGNVTFLPADSPPDAAWAFDTGPGGALIDRAVRRCTDGAEQFDRDGVMAMAGTVHDGLLGELLAHPYFRRTPPKTTGRELFGDAFADRALDRAEALGLRAVDAVATLTALTAESIAAAYRDFGPRSGETDLPLEVIVSGGGARNPVLIERLRRSLPDAVVTHSDAHGLPSDAKEAVLIALLGHECLHGRAANLPRCTGADGPAVLGEITPGKNYRALTARLAAEWRDSRPPEPMQRLRLASERPSDALRAGEA